MAALIGGHGLLAHRFRGRYYTELTSFESDLHTLGLRAIKDIPSDPDKYKGDFSKINANIFFVLTLLKYG